MGKNKKDGEAEKELKEDKKEKKENEKNIIAFPNFRKILEKEAPLTEKQRDWLKDYEGLNFSIGKNKKDLIFWQKEKEKYVYADDLWNGWNCTDFDGNYLYAFNINKIQRHKKRLVIEFDDKDNKKNSENSEKIVAFLKEKKWGFIKSTHGGKSDYLWIEFTKELSEKEAESFLTWISPKESKIDLNFASDKKRFPILFAEHWKYPKQNELPIEFFEGEQIDFDKLGLKIEEKYFKEELSPKKEFEGIDIKEISVTDIFGLTGLTKSTNGEYQGSHPIHGSTTGMNFCINPSKNLWHCHRCNTGGSSALAIAVKEGLIDCNDAKKGVLRGDLMKQVIQIAHEKYGLPVKEKEVASKVKIGREEKEKTEKREISVAETLVDLEELKSSIDDWAKRYSEGEMLEVLIEIKDYAKENKNSIGASEIKNIVKSKVQKILTEKAKTEILPKEDAETILKKAISNYYNKKDLAKKMLQIQPLYYDTGKNFWIWNKENFCWKITDETDILNMVGKLSDANIVNNQEKSEILEALRQDARLNKPLPIKETWIQFKEIIYDIVTGEKFKASPKFFVANPIPYKLHNDNYELTPTMDKIFEEWVGKDYVQTLYEIIAFCMMPSYPLHRLFCFVGNGLNGKSKFLELLRKFVGEDNCCSTELDTLLNSRFEITRLHKKLICQMGETNFNEISKTSIIKKLTGDDLIGFEYKNKNPFEDKNYAKIIIATNNLPTTTDKTIGFYRRWLIIDFPNTFSEKRNILNDIPEEEYESLALRSTGILKTLLETRAFHNEGSIEERMEKYEAKSDFLQKFLDEFTEQEPSAEISASDFFKKFSAWCKENRHREMAENTLGKKMKEKTIIKGKKYVDWLYDGKGGQIWIWQGIKWKE